MGNNKLNTVIQRASLQPLATLTETLQIPASKLDGEKHTIWVYSRDQATTVALRVSGPAVLAPVPPDAAIGPDAVTGFAFAATTITRADGGNWADDGYKIGDFVTIANAEDAANDGTFGPITAVDDAVDGAITIGSASFTPNAADTTATFAAQHTNGLPQTGNYNGKTGITAAAGEWKPIAVPDVVVGTLLVDVTAGATAPFSVEVIVAARK